MSEDVHCALIFKNMGLNFQKINETEQLRQKRMFINKKMVETTEVLPDEKEIEEENNVMKTAFGVKKFVKQMNKIKSREQRIDNFKKTLKTNNKKIDRHNENKGESDDEEDDDEKVNIPQLCELQRPWSNLTNDQRAYCIINYVHNLEIKDELKEHLRLILIQAITNKLLERNAVNYDEENMRIISFNALQFNEQKQLYYFN